MFKIGLFLLSSLSVISIHAKSPQVGDKAYRTWGQPSYEKDRFHDKNHAYGIYNPTEGYVDPDFNSATSLTNPLTLLPFESYDVAVIVNINNSKDTITGAPIRGQTIRVYAKEIALARIGDDRFKATQYDRTSNLLFYWQTSTARAGKSTPRGYFRPELFSSNHFSSLYNEAPMPWAVFFNGSIANHGVLGAPILKLGQAASAGCARLEPQRAKDLFHLIGNVGKGWVDKVSTSGTLVYTVDGAIEQEISARTLISVQ